MSTLVTYASQYGSTKEISERVASILSKSGAEVKLLPVSEVQSLDGYDNVVLGAAVYTGNWMPEAKQFVEEHASELSQKSVWVFSSGPVGQGDPVELLKGWEYPAAVKPTLDQIKPKDVTVFHGKLDLDKLGFVQRMMMKVMKAPTGDFRDWEMIDKWAEGVAKGLA